MTETNPHRVSAAVMSHFHKCFQVHLRIILLQVLHSPPQEWSSEPRQGQNAPSRISATISMKKSPSGYFDEGYVFVTGMRSLTESYAHIQIRRWLVEHVPCETSLLRLTIFLRWRDTVFSRNRSMELSDTLDVCSANCLQGDDTRTNVRIVIDTTDHVPRSHCCTSTSDNWFAWSLVRTSVFDAYATSASYEGAFDVYVMFVLAMPASVLVAVCCHNHRRFPIAENPSN